MVSLRALALATCLGLPLVGLAACNDDGGADDDIGCEPVEVPEPWLLAIDEDEVDGDALIQISVEPGNEGDVSVLCSDIALPPGFPVDTNFTSLSYQGQTLYASAARDTWGDTLMTIDPCTCTATEVGGFGFTLVSGLASNGDSLLLGLAADSDVLIAIDPLTANADERGGMTEDWVSNGLSRSGMDGLLYGLNAETDRLHVLRSDGVVVESIDLDRDFAAAGVEYHPGRGVLYACGVRDQERSLYAIDPVTGEVSEVSGTVFTTSCDNLAGPSGPIVCN